MPKRDPHNERLSQLPGHIHIAGRLLRWQPVFKIDLSRWVRADDVQFKRYRVLDGGDHVVGRYSQFGIAYQVLEFLYDEARLRGEWSFPTPSLTMCRDYMRKVEAWKATESARKAEAYYMRKLVNNARNQRERRDHRADVVDIWRMPGTPSRRRKYRGL